MFIDLRRRVSNGARALTRFGVLSAIAILASANPSLQLSSPAVAAGATSVNLSLTYSSNGNATPVSAVQWSFGYSSSDVASISVSAGTAATSSQKTVICSAASGTYTCLAYGAANQTPIENGILANVQISLAAKPSSSVAVQVTNPVASDEAGNSVPLTAAAGAISVSGSAAAATGSKASTGGTAASAASAPPTPLPTLTGLGCQPSFLIEPQGVTCTASLSAATLRAFQLTASSSSSAITVPTTVNVAAGASSVPIAVKASTSGSQSASGTITVTVGSSTVDTPLNVLPPLATSKFNVVNTKTGSCLTAIGRSQMAVATQSACSGATNDVVQLAAVSNGYELGFNSNKLFLGGATKILGTPVVTMTTSKSQAWELVPSSAGTFLILAVGNQQCLGLVAGAGNQQMVEETTCSSQPQNTWRFVAQ